MTPPTLPLPTEEAAPSPDPNSKEQPEFVPRRISMDEYFQIAQELESYHALFYKFWELGRPLLTTDIPTAAIAFNKEGGFVEFLFNPDFWEECDLYKKCFVIAHECLHVILDHGKRGSVQKTHPELWNVAIDIVVNHLLVDGFGFFREIIQDYESYCWLDTVFPDESTRPAPRQSAEHYYIRLVRNADFVEIKVLVDMHGGFGQEDSGDGNNDDQEDEQQGKNSIQWKDITGKLRDDILEQIGDELTPSEQKDIREKIKDEIPDTPGGGRGTSHGGATWLIKEVKPKILRRKWESIIKLWSSKYTRDIEKEQWVRKNRRFVTLSPHLMLPTDMEDEHTDRKRVRVFFYLDTSGSCYGYSERFTQVAKTLPLDLFDVQFFCFDTRVYSIDMKQKKVKLYGRGGTAFHIIEEHIHQRMKEEKTSRYPDAVFLLTDGYGNRVSPKHPDRWQWLLTDYSYQGYIPQDSLVHSLSNFE